MGRSARRAALRAAALAATTTTQLPLASFATSAELTSGAQFNNDRIILPLYCAGSGAQKKHLITTGFFFLLRASYRSYARACAQQRFAPNITSMANASAPSWTPAHRF